jgi:predicted secreted protein
MDTEDLKNIISFSITAEREVEQDFITIYFDAVETGSDPNLVQSALAEKLNAALALARPKKSDGVEVKTGTFQVSPSYNKKNVIDGYHGRVQLIVSGTDTATITGLTAEIKTMNVSGVGRGVSPALRKKVESELAIQAIADWRAKGKEYADAFGAASYSLHNATVNVSSGGYGRRGGVRMMAASASLESVGGGGYDNESGKEELTASVNGTLQLS